jgi:hypothetical protein
MYKLTISVSVLHPVQNSYNNLYSFRSRIQSACRLTDYKFHWLIYILFSTLIPLVVSFTEMFKQSAKSPSIVSPVYAQRMPQIKATGITILAEPPSDRGAIIE